MWFACLNIILLHFQSCLSIIYMYHVPNDFNTWKQINNLHKPITYIMTGANIEMNPVRNVLTAYSITCEKWPCDVTVVMWPWDFFHNHLLVFY
jgi:hypothetical protein